MFKGRNQVIVKSLVKQSSNQSSLDVKPIMPRRITKPPQPSSLRRLSHTLHLLLFHSPIDLGIASFFLLAFLFLPSRCLSFFFTLSIHLLLTTTTPLHPPHISSRPILLHNINKQIPTHVLCQPPHNLLPLFFKARHHKMSQQNPALRNPVTGKTQIAHLRMHSLDGLARRGGVVVCF